MADTNIGTIPADATPGAPLSDADLLEMYRRMTLVRTLDERIWMLNRQGKAAIVASSQGHEAGQIGSVWALEKGKDQFYIYYRDLAVMLMLGMTPIEIMSGFLAKEGEPLSGARQFPTHGAYPDIGLVNISNVVGTHIPQAVGAALANRMRGDDGIVITYFGDGASSVGDCHEAMNFAAIHDLPVIFFCENNKYAISVPISKQMAVESIASRAEGYGMPGIEVDGCDIMAVYESHLRSRPSRPLRPGPHPHRGPRRALPAPHLRRRRHPLPPPRGARRGPQARPPQDTLRSAPRPRRPHRPDPGPTSRPKPEP